MPVGITSASIAHCLSEARPFNHETDALIDAGRRVFGETIVIDPGAVRYELIRRKPSCAIMNEIDLTQLDALIVRGTAGVENSVAVLVETLHRSGVFVLDPPDLFTGAPTSKLLPTLANHLANIGSHSFVAFSRQSALQFLDTAGQLFPLIAKPVHGRQGIGLRKLDDRSEALAYVDIFFAAQASTDTALLLQQYEDFAAEYRALVLGGACLGVVEKSSAAGQIAANAARGGTVAPSSDTDVSAFAAAHARPRGLWGLDIGRLRSGELRLIEANRAPVWTAFQAATKVDVADAIMTHTKALSESSGPGVS